MLILHVQIKSAKMINITLPDGNVREYPSGVTAHEVALSISEGLARNVLSAVCCTSCADTCQIIVLIRRASKNGADGQPQAGQRSYRSSYRSGETRTPRFSFCVLRIIYRELGID